MIIHVFKKFVKWKNRVEMFIGQKAKTQLIDNGREYTSIEFEKYLQKKGIHHQNTIPRTPKKNGMAKRLNRILILTVRAMVSNSNLPKRF